MIDVFLALSVLTFVIAAPLALLLLWLGRRAEKHRQQERKAIRDLLLAAVEQEARCRTIRNAFAAELDQQRQARLLSAVLSASAATRGVIDQAHEDAKQCGTK